jgi:hypothetical protein
MKVEKMCQNDSNLKEGRKCEEFRKGMLRRWRYNSSFIVRQPM